MADTNKPENKKKKKKSWLWATPGDIVDKGDTWEDYDVNKAVGSVDDLRKKYKYKYGGK